MRLRKVNSKLFRVNLWEGLKGFAIGVLTIVPAKISEFLIPGTFPTKRQILAACFSAFIAYLMRKAMTNSEGKINVEPKPNQDEIVPPFIDHPSGRV